MQQRMNYKMTRIIKKEILNKVLVFATSTKLPIIMLQHKLGTQVKT